MSNEELMKIVDEQNKVIEEQYHLILWLGKYIRNLEEMQEKKYGRYKPFG